MPTYTYECYEEDEGCGYQFEMICARGDYVNQVPSCPKCLKKESVSRCYDVDLKNVGFHDEQPKTLGALALKNADKFSVDKKKSIVEKNTEYLRKKFTGKLPKGANSMKNEDGSVNVPTKQHKKDPRKKK